MSISPIGFDIPITRLQGSKATDGVTGSQDASVRPSADSVEISDAARFLAEIKRLPEIRQEKVQMVRDQIAAGQFETPERIDGTVDRLLAEFT